jgi:alpha-N-arabinofuranosidase
MIGPRGGKHWIIENCKITNARCVGIILGHAEGVKYDDIDTFGDHIVRNNVIRRCGEAGIAGQKCATRSLIAGNRIEETNYRREFGGWETAGIKFHESVDTVIRGNLIRGVYHQKDGAFGIWIDWGNQGTRITGNIICDTNANTVFLEMNHGAILVDNNVLVGAPIRNYGSEGNVYAHNLLIDSGFVSMNDRTRKSTFYKPHTREVADRQLGIAQDDRWYNNIFIRKGLDGVKRVSGYVSDHNVYLEGAKPSPFEGEHSVVEPRKTEFKMKDSPEGVTVSFTINDAPFRVKPLLVGPDLVGIFAVIGQTLEDRDGKKITIDTDYYGVKRSKPLVGPLAEMNKGPVTITWPPECEK